MIQHFKRATTLLLAVVCVAVTMVTMAAASGGRHALIIGNGEYEGHARLFNPPNDAKEVAEKLDSLGFQTKLVTDANLQEMRDALQIFSEESAGAEIAFIFYAGHGIQIDSQNYLVPVDGDLRQPSKLANATLSGQAIWEELVRSAPEVAILVLDACRNNPYTEGSEVNQGLASGTVSPSDFVQRPNSAGVLIGFAAAPGAVAYDGNLSSGNSPYTTALLKWIDRPGMEIGSMFRGVRSTVMDLTGGAQVPWVEEALLREVFLNPDEVVSDPRRGLGVEETFVALFDTLEDPVEREVLSEFYTRLTGTGLVFQPASLPVEEKPDPDVVPAGLVWLAVRDSNDELALRSFVETYPDSPFARLANDKLKTLLLGAAPEEPSTEPEGDLVFEPVSQEARPEETDLALAGQATGESVPVAVADETVPQEEPEADKTAQQPAPEAPAVSPTPEASTSADSGLSSSDREGSLQFGAVDEGGADAADDALQFAAVADEGQPPRPETPEVPVSTPPGPVAAAPQEVTEEAAAPSGAPQPSRPASSASAESAGAADAASLEPSQNAPEAVVEAVPQEQTPPAAPQPTPQEIEELLALDRDAFRAVQVLLAQEGFYRGAIDAIFGPGTRGGLARFQEREGLDPAGYLDQPTIDALVSGAAGAVLRGRLAEGVRDAVHRLAAIGKGGADAVPTVVRVAAQSRNDEVHAYWDELALEFEADHPGNRIEITHQPDWQYKQNLLPMLGSDEPPALLHTWGGNHLKALVDGGFVRDITPEMAGGWALNFRPGALQNYTIGDRIFGAPHEVALISLWLNKPLLDQAGIAVEQLSTWDGFLSAVRTLKDNGIVPLAVGGRDSWTFQLIWGNLAIAEAGREAVEAALNNTGSGFSSEPFIKASERLRELSDLSPFQPDFAAMNEAEAGNALARGDAAMVVTGNWRLSSMRWNWPGGLDRMREELVRVEFPLPDGGERTSATYGGANGYAVNVDAPDIAVEFLRVLTSMQTQKRISDLSGDVPATSASDLSIDDPLIADVAERVLGSSYHQLYFDQALGPVAGEVVNEVAMQLGFGEIDGRTAAERIQLAWVSYLNETERETSRP